MQSKLNWREIHWGGQAEQGLEEPGTSEEAGPAPSGAGALKSGESHLGQLLTYLLGAQVKRFQVLRNVDGPHSVTPVLGLFLDQLKVWDIRKLIKHH